MQWPPSSCDDASADQVRPLLPTTLPALFRDRAHRTFRTHHQSTRSGSWGPYHFPAFVACFRPSPHLWLFVPLSTGEGPIAYRGISSSKIWSNGFPLSWSQCSRPFQSFLLKDQKCFCAPSQYSHSVPHLGPFPVTGRLKDPLSMISLP
jgi:hypothetical protein